MHVGIQIYFCGRLYFQLKDYQDLILRSGTWFVGSDDLCLNRWSLVLTQNKISSFDLEQEKTPSVTLVRMRLPHLPLDL